MVQPLKFTNGQVISSHTLLSMWFLIHVHYQIIIITNAANTIYDAQEHASMKLKSSEDVLFLENVFQNVMVKKTVICLSLNI